MSDDGEVTPQLQRLLENRKRPQAIQVWRAFTAEERRSAARAFVAVESAGRKRLNDALAAAMNSRSVTIAKRPLDDVLGSRGIDMIKDPQLVQGLVRRSQVPGNLEMVTQFLDGLGVPHEVGEVRSLKMLDASDYSVCKQATALADERGHRAVAIMLVTYRVQGAPLGEKARKWLKGDWDRRPPPPVELPVARADRGDSTRLSGAPRPVLTETTGVDQTEDADKDDPVLRASLTTLDRLLINAAADAAR